ncbi:MAG TPA: DUF4824 family protein, partial [Steroidobacteraceae bacterium]
FDAVTLSTVAGADTHYRRMAGRDVLLVLELDGPVRVRALHAARDHFAHLEQEIAANPESQGSAQRLQRAQQALQSEEHAASRLFIIDAGLDRSALRQRYSDRTHYAIVHGNISPMVTGDGTSAKVYGVVTAVRCENINVPLQFRATVAIDRPINGIVMSPTRSDKRSPFTIRVAFGRHLEPWILSSHAGPT